MDFKRLQHFIHTAELGNITKACERLNIVQPALSQSIKRLEEELGTTLFIRSRQGVELTEAGTTFLNHAYGILNQYNKAKESVATIGKAPSGHVSLALTSSALNAMTLPFYEMLAETHPDISISLEEGLAANIQLGLNAGWYDLVISHLVESGERVKSELLTEEALLLVAPANDDLPEGAIEFEQLKDIPLIIPQDHHGVWHDIHQAANEAGISLPKHQVRAAMYPTLKIVESGMGYSLMPWSAIFDRVEAGVVSCHRLINPTLSQKVYLSHPTHKPLTPATIAVMEIVRKTVKLLHEQGKWQKQPS